MIPYISKLGSFEEFIEKFHKLGNKYEQESILVMQPTEEIFLLIYEGNKDLNFGNIKFDVNNENPKYFSILAKGNHRIRKWEFEGLAIPDTMFGKHSAYCKGKMVTG